MSTCDRLFLTVHPMGYTDLFSPCLVSSKAVLVTLQCVNIQCSFYSICLSVYKILLILIIRYVSHHSKPMLLCFSLSDELLTNTVWFRRRREFLQTPTQTSPSGPVSTHAPPPQHTLRHRNTLSPSFHITFRFSPVSSPTLLIDKVFLSLATSSPVP